MASPWAPKMKDKVIRPEKPKGVSKSPWERKIRKRAKEAQGKLVGQGCPKGNKWDKRAHKQCNTKPKWPYWVIERRISNMPKEAQQAGVK